jgi:RNA polymerase sigma-70 factor, ECF subfamily
MNTGETDTGIERSDQEYVQTCRNGHPDDFRFLVKRYQGVLFAFLVRRLGGDRSLAEDAAQETLLRAFTALRKLNKPESFNCWLLGIAGHVAHEFQRASSRKAELQDALEIVATDKEQGEDYSLDEAIAALPELHRRIILLRYFEDLSCQQVAERLNMPLGTVTKTLSRAYAQLRLILQTQMPQQMVKNV